MSEKKIEKLLKQMRNRFMGDCYEPAATYICEHAVPCIRFVDKGKLKRTRVGQTRMGGVPDLPAKLDWPTDDESGESMLFLGQVNFSQCPHWPNSPLPESGLLSIFYGPRSARAMYFDESQQLAKRQSPDSFFEYFEELSPCKVKAELGLSIPAHVKDFQKKVIELCDNDDDSEELFIGEYLGYANKNVGVEKWFAQMLGYASAPVDLHRTKYHEMAACEQLGVDARGTRGSFNLDVIDAPKVRAKILKTALRSPLLLSMDSANSTGSMWSDCGLIYLITTDKAIAKRKFGEAFSYMYH